MNFKRLSISDIILIEPHKYKDKRGYFLETYRQDELNNFLKKKINFCQENKSFSYKNVFRGLHYQIPPFSQSKLISVSKGEIIDIVVDIRKNSPTYGKCLTIILDDNTNNELFIPRGFAHGFFVKSEYAVVSYKVDNFYSKKSEKIINIKDSNLNLNLDFSQFIISEKDSNSNNLNDVTDFDYNINYYD